MRPPSAPGGAPDPLVLWVVPVAELGGVARHTLDLLGCGLPGLRTVLLCPPGPLAERARRAGQAVLAEPLGPSWGLAASLRTVRGAVARLRPQAVHTHLAYADLLGTLALAADRSCALVSTEHGIAPDPTLHHATVARAALARAAHRARLRRVDRLIAVSRSTARTVREHWRPRCPVSVVPNGVDLDAVREAVGTPRRRVLGDGLRLLSLSRLAPEKRLDQVLRAMPRVLARDPRATATFAGDGPQREELADLARRLGVAEAVRFPGHLDPWPAMADHDVLVQVSAWENLSYTLLDAAAAGMPVLASDVGGNGEILPPEALLEQVGPSAIVDGLRRVTAEPVAAPVPSDLAACAQATARIVRGALR